MQASPTTNSRLIPTHRPTLGNDELAAVARVFESGWLGQGAMTLAFEDALRSRLAVPHVVAVGSGTAALHLALEALDLPSGAGVLVPSMTFVATVQAILAAHLRPIFCEVDPDSLQLDINDCRARAEQAERDGTTVRVVMPVHFGGACCDLSELTRVAAERNITIVEDAAHAFGSSFNGRPLGTSGVAGCFSFDPIKNITCGEGGAIATSCETMARRLRTARALGISSDGWSRHTGAASWAYTVVAHGWRSHLPDLNAAIGLAQLARLPQFLERRQAIVACYDRALASVPGVTPITRPSPEVCPFTYAVRVHHGRRDGLMAHLRSRGIGTSVEYIPNHLQPAFAAYRTSLPTTERLFTEILSLPLYVDLSDKEVHTVISAVVEFCEKGDGS